MRDAELTPPTAPPPVAEQPVPRFFLVLIVAATVMLAIVVRPIVSELFLAAVLASVLWPLQRSLSRRLRGHDGIAATLLTVVVVILLVGPIATLVTYVARDGTNALRFLADTARSEPARELIRELPAAVQEVVRDGIRQLPRDLGEAVQKVDAAEANAAVAKGARVTLHGVFMLIALYVLLRRGNELVDWLDDVSPLRRGRTRELLAGFKRVSYAVVMSTVVTSAVQALVAFGGYLITQVPNATFFAIVTFFVAFIPAIGAGTVCLAAAGLLFVLGRPYAALFLALWGLVVVGLVDNVVKPLLIKRGMELNGFVVFFALIGGLSAFGAIGLLVGPLAVAFFLALLRMYHRDFSPAERRLPKVPGHPPGRVTADERPPVPTT